MCNRDSCSFRSFVIDSFDSLTVLLFASETRRLDSLSLAEAATTFCRFQSRSSFIRDCTFLSLSMASFRFSLN